MYPAMDDHPWPTLGPDVCAFIEGEMCFGPGDLFREPAKLDDEQRAWIWRLYEVYPPIVKRRSKQVIVKDPHPQAGRRRFQRCALSLRKGSRKTELAAWIAIAEVHPDGPVRTAGWHTVRGVLVPTTKSVTDPYIPMISYTEEQTEELAYGAARRILEECRIGKDFDIGLERIMRLRGDGKMEAVSASPNSRDGARTTFEHADETHRFTLDRMKRGWSVMLANLAKRPLADPWALETTTAPEPGAGSVAETTMQHAQELSKKPGTARMFFFHRQASDKHDIMTDSGVRAAVIEASGPYIAKWSDIDRIVEQFHQPDADRVYLERVWLNRLVQSSGRAFDIDRWRELVRPGFKVPDGEAVALGFDGSRYDDATALVATHMESGFQWPLGIWERPLTQPDWEVPVHEVDEAIAAAFARYAVTRMYGDPPKWDSWMATWAGRYGEKRVLEWWTNRPKPMAYAIRSYVAAIAGGDLSHDGDKLFEKHVAHARRKDTRLVDEQGQGLWILRKERPDSPDKIDAAMAGVLSWEAYNDSRAAGQGGAPSLTFLSFAGRP
jgi:phage terminase large subunit-like protein